MIPDVYGAVAAGALAAFYAEQDARKGDSANAVQHALVALQHLERFLDYPGIVCVAVTRIPSFNPN